MSALQVNEAKVFATGRGAAWWVGYRERAEAADRVTVEVASVGGDLVQLACDDGDHAAWLAEFMRAQGLPASAVKVVR